MPKTSVDRAVLEAALHGYQNQLAYVSQQIAKIQQRLKKSGWTGPRPFASLPVAPNGNRISKAGKARIAEAQRRRWAAYKKQKSAAESPSNDGTS